MGAARRETLPLSFCGPAQQSYLEMSPQYHSASCRVGGLPPFLDGVRVASGPNLKLRRRS